MLIEITYNVTDVFMSTTETPVYVEISFEQPGSASAVWGSITGTLSNQTDLQNALNLKVPYTGATTNVNLGEYELKAGQVTLDTSPTGTAAVGTIRWNDTTGTSETTLKGGNVIIKNGVDLVARVVNKVSPNTTLTKAAYQAVRVSGAQGQRLAIELAQANNDAGSADTIGLVTETIAPNQEGFIMTVGQLEGINTTGSLQGETWVDGDVLYLSPTTAGAVTNVKPTAVTGHIVVIGYVEYAHVNNGKIYVKVMNGWELDELHNVSIVTPANNQGLFYNSTSTLWENKSITTALGYTPVPTTRNITINGVTYDLSADRTYTISTGISGSGASGQVTYWTGSSAVSGSNNLFWDNTNKRLHIGGTVTDIWNQYNGVFQNGQLWLLDFSSFGISEIASNTYFDGTNNRALRSYGANKISLQSTHIGFLTAASVTAGSIQTLTEKARLTNVGNLMLNSTTDSGEKLQVTGDVKIVGSGATSATRALTIQNSSLTNIFRVRNDGLSISVGGFAVGGVSSFAGIFPSDSGNLPTITINSSADLPTTNITDIVLSNAQGNATITSGTRNLVQISRGFNPTSGTGVYNLLQITTTINQTGGANGITRGLYVAPTLTAAADWRSIEWSNNSGWGLYGAGSANNYLAGRLGIGTTSLSAVNLAVYRNITGSIFAVSISSQGLVQSDVTNTAFGYYAATGTQATTFTLQSLVQYQSDAGSFGAGSTITDHVGFRAANIPAANVTNAFAFQGGMASGTGRWNLYMNGTAANYMNGELLLGSTTNTGEKLQVTGTMKVTGASTFSSTITATGNITSSDGTSSVIVQTTSNAPRIVLIDGRIGGKRFDLGPYPTGTTGNFSIHDSTANATRLIIDESGNLGIGITPTVRLHVSGDTILRGSGATSATTALTVQNSASTNLFTVRNDGAVSIGAASYNDGLRINRNPILANASSIFVNTAIQTTVNTIYRGIATSVGLFGSGFTLPNLSHFECINDGSFTAGVVTNLYGFRENLGTYVATNVYGFYGAIPAASGRWNLYMNGTADNYLAGDLGIGTTSVTNWLNIGASTTAKAHINLASGVAPTSPANGDIWFDGTDIKMRIGGVTKTFTLI